MMEPASIGTTELPRESRKEEALLAEQAFRRAIEVATAVGVAAVDMVGRQIYVNPAFCRMVGWREEELLGKTPPHVYWVPEKRDEIMALLRAALAGEAPTEGFELPFRRRNGEQFVVQVQLRPFLDQHGVQIGWMGSMIDISERKRKEEELFTSRELLRTVIDAIPQRLFWKDRQSRYLGVNRPLAEDLGLESTDDLVGRDDDQMPWRFLAELHRSDDRRIMEQDCPELRYVEQMVLPDGEQRWVRTSKTPLQDRQGRVIGVVGSYEDITEQKRNEEDLIASERRYRHLFNRMLDGFVLFAVVANPSTNDKEFYITEVNAALAAMVGRSPVELMGRSLPELGLFEEQEWRPHFDEVAETGAPTTFEIRAGSLGLVLRASIYRPEEGQVAAIFEDVTTEHRLLTEMERLARVDSLTGLWNRRFFLERAEEELVRLHRYQRPMSLLMMDLDHFKRVNDTWGHHIGDQVLAAVGGAIRENLRQVDLAGRYGGEELVVLLPETEYPEAQVVAERLRSAVAALRIPVGETVLTVTISCGMTSLRGDERLTLGQAMDQADQALYRAKRGGRNRTVVYCSEGGTADREGDHA